MVGTENLHSKILVIGITNIPWELDVATIRRFDKKLLLGMPTQEERRRIIQKYSATEEMSEGEWGDIMCQTDGYTGSDLKILIADASMVAMKEKNCSKISYKHIMAGLKHCKPSVPRPMQSLFQTFLSKFGDDSQNKFAGERTNGLSYFS
jgi:SpoVK/Ycf46/Vps4 family AAA+-type ATPase